MKEKTLNIMCDGYNVKGILTFPSEINRNMILFIGNPLWPSWGPGRIVCEAARKFSEYGYICFRFEIICFEESKEESIMLIDKYQQVISNIITYLLQEFSPSGFTVIGFCFGSYLSLKFTNIYKESPLVLWSIDVSAYDKYSKSFSKLRYDQRDKNVLQGHFNSAEKDRRIPLLVINGDYIKNQNKNKEAISRILPRNKFDMTIKVFYNCDEHFSTLCLKKNLINQTLKWLNYEYDKRRDFE